MKTEPITYDELAAELDLAADAASADFRTARELGEAWGRGERVVSRILHAAKAAGRLEYRRVVRSTLDGRQATVQAYRITPAPDKKGRKR